MYNEMNEYGYIMASRYPFTVHIIILYVRKCRTANGYILGTSDVRTPRNHNYALEGAVLHKNI